ncbi:hypothetical protein [Mediterranea massiliensis]|uniref:hypothetical protein n=1 Tax=Mediterranea massiliensis TaxID=1841865 RepID=UPI0025A42D43|nr:hypothetical protein [Mediterranea massiliensis]MDM8337048.1 hypothetical protein [Mediterranea massiliensis]
MQLEPEQRVAGTGAACSWNWSSVQLEPEQRVVAATPACYSYGVLLLHLSLCSVRVFRSFEDSTVTDACRTGSSEFIGKVVRIYYMQSE